MQTGRLRKLRVGDEAFSNLPVKLAQRGEGRPENGLLPTNIFRYIYFNNRENFVILNPRLSEQRTAAKQLIAAQ